MNWRKIIEFSTKILIVILAFWYIVYKLLKFNWSDQSYSELFSGNIYSYWILIIVILLMFINWGTESFKWKYLISHHQKINFFQSFKAVVGGITFSLITPNRIGEPIGRILFLKKEIRAKAAVSTIVGSISQFTVTIVPGALATAILILNNSDILHVTSATNYLIAALLFLLVILALLCYFNIHILEYILIKLFRLKKFLTITDHTS
ncbi:MAG: lysylphosphatidylglycerol synthase domain-containing protein [Bacteroidota bacterium]